MNVPMLFMIMYSDLNCTRDDVAKIPRYMGRNSLGQMSTKNSMGYPFNHYFDSLSLSWGDVIHIT
jgi:hypothetical protein